MCISLELPLNSLHFLLLKTRKSIADKVLGLPLKQYQETIDQSRAKIRCRQLLSHYSLKVTLKSQLIEIGNYLK